MENFLPFQKLHRLTLHNINKKHYDHSHTNEIRKAKKKKEKRRQKKDIKEILSTTWRKIESPTQSLILKPRVHK